MARTALFSRLCRLAAIALGDVDGRDPPGSRALGRRELLLAAAATGPAVLGCASQTALPSDEPEAPSLDVAIVGAGLAGLYCAYWLEQADVAFTLYEASARTGGRAFSVRDRLPEGLVAELGGEFVDSAHATMLGLADELGIALDDRTADLEGLADAYWVAGNRVEERVLLEQLTASREAFVSALRELEEGSPKFAELDGTPLSVWLQTNVGSNNPQLLSVLTTAYRNEFGLETDQQSALNLLYLVGLDSETLRVLGEADRRYRVRGGVGTLVDELAGKLTEPIEFGRRLVTVEQSGADAYLLTFETEARTGVQVQASRVVFALPFSVLRLVDLDRSGLSVDKLRVIENLGYGTNTKLAGAFSARPWRDQYESSGNVLADLPFQQVWDGSTGQADAGFVLTNLTGGEGGSDAGAGTAEEAMTAMLGDLNKVFPNVSATYVEGTAVRAHWPSSPLFRGSVACYRFRQWTAFWKREGTPEGRLYFCGEHCSADFQRSLEGAAETGALTAARLLDDLEVALPSRLADLVRLKTAVPQPCYDRNPEPDLGPLERRRAVLRAHAEFVHARRFRGS